MTRGPIPCVECEHLILAKGVRGFRCHAYPDGIPGEILGMDVFHNRILDGQVGDAIFTPAPGREASVRKTYVDEILDGPTG